MKPIRVLIGTLVVCGSFASAQELTKEAKIERILALTNAQAVMDQMFAQIKTSTASMMPAGSTPEQSAKVQEIQEKLLDFVKDRMSWDKVRPKYVKIYDETFSDEEITGILAFYQAPAGRAMLEKLPTLISKSMSVAQSQMTDIMPEISASRKSPCRNSA